MTLPKVSNPEDWLGPQHLDAAVSHLQAFASKVEGVDVSRLASDPYGVLGKHANLTIKHSEEPAGGCAVFGHYLSDPPTIHIVRASAFGRDHFTLLHEYAHHLQQHDADWAEVEWRIKPEALRLRITEAIANVFASTVLIPDQMLTSISAVPTARQIAGLQQSVQASRQATIVRVAQSAMRSQDKTPKPFFISLVDRDGCVVFSQVVGEGIYPPPRGSRQSDIRHLFGVALSSNSTASGVTSEGIVYSSGATRTDVKLDLHLSHDGRYAFVVGTKKSPYGKPQWATPVHLCSSVVCEREFFTSGNTVWCSDCKEPRCPDCRTCECEPVAHAFCLLCFTELSAVEQRSNQTRHAECP